MGSTGAPPAAWLGPGIERSSNRSQSTYLRPLRVQARGAGSQFDDRMIIADTYAATGSFAVKSEVLRPECVS